jgi:hypothetical protein
LKNSCRVCFRLLGPRVGISEEISEGGLRSEFQKVIPEGDREIIPEVIPEGNREEIAERQS